MRLEENRAARAICIISIIFSLILVITVMRLLQTTYLAEWVLAGAGLAICFIAESERLFFSKRSVRQSKRSRIFRNLGWLLIGLFLAVSPGSKLIHYANLSFLDWITIAGATYIAATNIHGLRRATTLIE